MQSNIMPYRQEVARKLIHLTSLFVPLFIYYLSDTHSQIFLISLTSTIIIIDYCRLRNTYCRRIFNYFLSFVIRKYEKESLLSGTYMLISFTIISIFFNPQLCIYAMLIAIISDTVAAIIGIKYGKIILINQKTLEGSYAFFISTILIFLILNFTQSIFMIFVISLLSTITELLSPTKIDNFTLPIINVLLLYFLL